MGVIVPRGSDSDPGVELVVDSLASDGRGVARRDGRVWFVPGALPGDRVVARPVRERPRYVEAAVVRRLADGPDRRPVPCPVQARCGGCAWMALAEHAQRRAKRRRVVEALRRIAGVADPAVDPVDPSPLDLRYRNKVEFVLGDDRDGRPVAGLHAAGSSAPIDVPRCLVQHDDADRVWGEIRETLAAMPEDLRRRWWSADRLRVAVRRSWTTGDLLVVLRARGDLPGEGELARAVLASHPLVRGVVRVETRSGRRGGARERVLAGVGTVEERWVGTTFRLPASVFFQVNPAAAERLAERVTAACGPPGGRRVLDLYGGVGAYAWWSVRGGDRAVVVEADAAAVACGRTAEGGASGRAPRFDRETVGRWIGARARGIEPPDLVIVNPPRAGMEKGVPRAVAALSAGRVVLVSCDPGTLARDVRSFLAAGYRLDRVTPVDLFPQTPHVETVATLVPATA